MSKMIASSCHGSGIFLVRQRAGVFVGNCQVCNEPVVEVHTKTGQYRYLDGRDPVLSSPHSAWRAEES
jgi:hypothetical protein